MVTNLYIFIPAKFLKKLKKVSAKILYIKYICIYVSDSQIVHHNPCFNLFILHDNQGSKIKNDKFQHTVFYGNFLPTTKESTTTFLLLRRQ